MAQYRAFSITKDASGYHTSRGADIGGPYRTKVGALADIKEFARITGLKKPLTRRVASARRGGSRSSGRTG